MLLNDKKMLNNNLGWVQFPKQGSLLYTEAFPCVTPNSYWLPGTERKARAWLLTGLVCMVFPPFPLRWLKFPHLFHGWGLEVGKALKYSAVSKRFGASKIVRVSQMSCLLPQPAPNPCCPSSSFHAALYAHRHWHLGSDAPFPGSGGDRGCQEFQSVDFAVIPASKHTIHLLKGKNKAALFNFWKKPDDSGKGQKYAHQPSLSHCLSCCFLRDRSMWLLKIPCKENTFSLQWASIN